MSHVPDELHDELHDLGVSRREAAAVVEELTGLTALATVAPRPTAALAALFGEAAPASARLARPSFGAGTRRRASRSGVVGALVLALSGVGATGMSAAASSLPAPLQQRVSEFSHHYLPFHFPAPAVPALPGPAVQDAGRERPREARERPAPPLRPAEPADAPVTSAVATREALSPEVVPGRSTGRPAATRGDDDAADREVRPSRSAAPGSPRAAMPATALTQPTRPRWAAAAPPPTPRGPAVRPTTEPATEPAAEPEPNADLGASLEHGRPTFGVTAGATPRPTLQPRAGEPWQPAPDPTRPPTTVTPTPVPSPGPPPATPPPQAQPGADDPEVPYPEPPLVPVEPTARPIEELAP